MKIHSPAFEKTLKRQCKRAVRTTPEARREYSRIKGHSRFQRQYSFFRFVRPIFSLVFGCMVFAVAQQIGHRAPALALVSLLAFVFATYRARNLLNQLYAAPDLAALVMLPISEQEIFRWEFQKMIRRSVWSLLDLSIAFAGLGVYYHFSAVQYALLLLISVIVWIMVVALAVFGAAFFPRLPYRIITLALFAILWFCVLNDWFRAEMVALLDAYGRPLSILLPTGWAVSLFNLLTPPIDWFYLLLVAPVAVIIGSVRISIARLRRDYSFHEPMVPEAPDILPTSEAEVAAAVPGSARIDIEELIASRRFLAATQWQQRGWLEKILWKWLSERERVLVEFAFANGIEIQKPWRKILITMVVASLLSGVVSLLSSAVALCIMGAGLFGAFCAALQQLSGARCFHAIPSSGIAMPVYSAYPVGYSELARMLFKRAVVQIPLLFAGTIAGSLILAYVAHFPMAAALIFGVKIGGVLFAATFIFVALGFSGGTNDTEIRWRTAHFVLVMMACAVVGIGLGLGAFLPVKPLVSWICWALLILDEYAFFRIYGYFYNRNTFDLMRMPPQQQI